MLSCIFTLSQGYQRASVSHHPVLFFEFKSKFHMFIVLGRAHPGQPVDVAAARALQDPGHSAARNPRNPPLPDQSQVERAEGR